MNQSAIILLLFFSSVLTAQISRNDSRINDAFTDLTNRIRPNSYKLGSTNLNGSPYFDPQFKESKVVYFGKALDDKIFLRYNAISDEMEMSLSPYSTESDQALIKNSKVYCSIQGVVYRYLPLTEGNSSLAKAGYVREVYRGQHFSLYLRERKVFREGKKARTSLERSFPPRFVDDSEWYIQTKEEALQFIKPTKKNFKNYFKSNSTRLETFLKSEKGDFKNIEYLKKLVQYMDQVKK